MKITEKIAARVQGLLTTPKEELGRWGRFLRFQIQLWRFCARRLREHNAMAMSAALAFRTIFALIPILVLSLLVMKSLGMAEQGKLYLQEFLSDTGLAQIHREVAQPERPQRRGGRRGTARGATTRPRRERKDLSLAEEIEKLVERAERKVTVGTIGPVGAVLLVWSAVTLLTTLERSLNRIFGARRSRALGRRVMLYWSVITLGPVLMMAGSVAGYSISSLAQGVPGFSWLLKTVAWAGPGIMGIILLAALYKLMPNTKVSYRAAIGGAIVAVPLFLVAMWGFGQYVGRLVGKEHLYGSLGVLPLFLIWVNFSWLILLFGAELAHTATNLSRLQSAEAAERILLGPDELLAATLAVTRGFARGKGAVPFEQIAAGINLPDDAVQTLLDRLVDRRVLCPVSTPGAAQAAFVLARPAGKIPLAEVLELSEDRVGAELSEGAIARAVADVRGRTRQALGELTLADIAPNDAG